MQLMRYRSESRYTGGGRGCQSLFPNSSTDRNSSLSSGGGREASFPAARAKQTATRVASQRNPSRPVPFLSSPPVSSPFRLLAAELSARSLTYLLTFHARKPNVYYRACLAISVLYFSLPPSLPIPVVREKDARTRGSIP